jgi:hypothetical protein
VTGPVNRTFNEIANQLATGADPPARTSHVPLIALRVAALLARPCFPAFARQAHAAVIMNTTDMTGTTTRTPVQIPPSIS